MIVSSSIIEDCAQIDGRRWVTEQHVDQLSIAHAYTYLAAAAEDAVAAMNARVPLINAMLTAGEIEGNVSAVLALGSAASYTLNFSTAAQNFAALRAAYQTATQQQAVMVADFLNSLSDTVLENAFGLSLVQVTALRTSKLAPAATTAAAIRAATGA